RCLLEMPDQQLRSQAVHQEEGCSAGRAHTELVVVSGYPEGRGQRGGDRGQGVRPVRGYTDLLVRGAVCPGVVHRISIRVRCVSAVSLRVLEADDRIR